MYIHIILNPLYSGHIYHAYINALYRCIKEKGAVITNEEYITEKLHIEDIYFQVFDMEAITEAEQQAIPQLGIPVSFYRELERRYTSRTASLESLFSERNEAFEKMVETFIQQTEETLQEKLEGFYIFGEAYESVRYLGEKHQYKIINYEFTTIRKEGGFPLNLMYGTTNGRLYGHDEARIRYEAFKRVCKEEELFSREELVALFAKKEQLIYVPLLEREGVYEMGICETGYKVVPQMFYVKHITDDDLHYLCSMLYKNDEIVYRDHPTHVNPGSIDHAMKQRDPVPFLLSCKRISAVASNTLFEAMLWNRVACVAEDILSLSVGCEHDFKSDKKAELSFLNYCFFSFFVPSQERLFSKKYWNWRKSSSEREVYQEQRKLILSELGLDETIFRKGHKERFFTILKARGIESLERKMIIRGYHIDQVDYQQLASYLEIRDKSGKLIQGCQCLNELKAGKIKSQFISKQMGESMQLWFYPFCQTVGVIQIEKIVINKTVIGEYEGFEYVPAQWHFDFWGIKGTTENNITIIWSYKTVDINGMLALAKIKRKERIKKWLKQFLLRRE